MRIEDFLKKNFFTIAEYGQFKNFASNCPTAFSSVSDSVFFSLHPLGNIVPVI